MEEPFKIFGNFFRKLGQIFEPFENFSGSESFGQIPSFAFLKKNSFICFRILSLKLFSRKGRILVMSGSKQIVASFVSVNSQLFCSL